MQKRDIQKREKSRGETVENGNNRQTNDVLV